MRFCPVGGTRSVAESGHRTGSISSSERPVKGIETIWVIREKVGLLQTAHEPVQLTAGPIHTHEPVPSPDGKRVFFAGAQPELRSFVTTRMQRRLFVFSRAFLQRDWIFHEMESG
jgi:hypothetical protein